MKLIVTLALVLSAGIAQAQPTEPAPAPHRPMFGARVGVGLANLTDEGGEGDTDNRTGLIVGGFATIPVGPNLELEIDALYSQKGAKVSDGDLDATIALDYVSIPVLLAGTFPISPTSRVRIYAGPNLNIKVNAELTVGDESVDFDDAVADTDYGVVAGAGFAFAAGGTTVFIDGRYEYGLSDIAEESDGQVDDEVKHRVVSITAGFAF